MCTVYHIIIAIIGISLYLILAGIITSILKDGFNFTSKTQIAICYISCLVLLVPIFALMLWLCNKLNLKGYELAFWLYVIVVFIFAILNSFIDGIKKSFKIIFPNLIFIAIVTLLNFGIDKLANYINNLFNCIG